MRAMARKKDKIRVELDLPKDDSTPTKLYVILGISMFLGVASLGFWVTNSGFLPTTNDADVHQSGLRSRIRQYPSAHHLR